MGAGALDGTPAGPAGQWVGDRSEDFVASTHGRDSVVRARMALDRDGSLLALETTVLANLGAYVSTVAPASLRRIT